MCISEGKISETLVLYEVMIRTKCSVIGKIIKKLQNRQIKTVGIFQSYQSETLKIKKKNPYNLTNLITTSFY